MAKDNKCGGRSVIQVLVVRVDIGVVTYEGMTPHCHWFRLWLQTCAPSSAKFSSTGNVF